MPEVIVKKDYIFWWKENIRWGDQDAMGHVNNVQFARYIEASRIPFLRKFIGEITAEPAHFILARLEVDYLTEMHFPGQVLIGTNVTDVGNTSVTLSHGLFKDKVCTARGKSTVVHINLTDRRPRAISNHLRDQLLEGKARKS